MKKFQRGFTLPELFVVGWLAVVVALAGGWIANIVKMIGMNFDVISGMLVARIVGIFVAPMGGVLGYF